MDYGEIWVQVRLEKMSMESSLSSWLSDSQDELLVASLEKEGCVDLGHKIHRIHNLKNQEEETEESKRMWLIC